MTVSTDFLEYVLDLLAPLCPITTRRMFGSVGLYHDGRMFAIVSGENRFYVKSDSHNKSQFEQAGCRPFTYTKDTATGAGKTIALSFYAPPESVLDDRHEILEWAQIGIEAAARVPEKKHPTPSFRHSRR